MKLGRTAAWLLLAGCAAPDPAECLLTRQELASGDGSARGLRTFTYDDRGRPLTVVEDEEFDGIVDWIQTNEWDERGNLLATTTDESADGELEVSARWTYDDRDRVLTSAEDTVRITTLWAERSEYTYAGDQLAVEAYELRVGGAPAQDWERAYAYDGGRLASVVQTGTIPSTLTYTYDADGWLVRTDEDFESDGTIDQTVDYTNDDRGRVIEQRWIEAGTGDDITLAWTYDDADRVLTYDHWVFVVYYATTMHEQMSYTYDADGRPLSERRSYDSQGPLYLQTWEYDGDGNLVRDVYDYHADGQPDTVTTTDYRRGLARVEEVDEGGDGEVDLRTESFWDCR